jgi:hypothetical protein
MDVDYRLPRNSASPSAECFASAEEVPAARADIVQTVAATGRTLACIDALCLKSGFTPLGTYDKQLSELATRITGFR